MERNYIKADLRTIRNEFLPLHTKVAVISFYDRNPVYRSVALHFPCSAKYIQTIIESRDEILEEWNKQTFKLPINEKKMVVLDYACRFQYRANTQREMQILNNELDVWIRECMNEPNFVASDERLKAKATELMKLYNLKDIVPDEDWILSIREKYNMKKVDDLPSAATEGDTSSRKTDSNLAAETEVQNRILNSDPWNKKSRKFGTLKLELLNETMIEWISRMQSRGNEFQLTAELIRQTAKEANKHIKVYTWNPGRAWLKDFREKYSLTSDDLRNPHPYKSCSQLKKVLSLEIPDIINFVKQKKYRKSGMQQTFAESHRYQIAYNNSNCGNVVEVVVPVDEDAYSPRTSQEVGKEIGDDGVLLTCEEGVDDDVPITCQKGVDDVDYQPAKIKRGNVGQGISIKPSTTRRKIKEVINSVVPVKGKNSDGGGHQPVPTKRNKKRYRKLRNPVQGVVPIKPSSTRRRGLEVVDSVVPLKCFDGGVDLQPGLEDRYKKTYSRLKRGNVAPHIVPIEPSSTPTKTLKEVAEINADIGPVRCEEVVDGDVPITCEKVVEDGDHKPATANRYKKTYSRLKRANVIPSIVPIKDSPTLLKSLEEVIKINHDVVPVKCEEVVDGDVPVKGTFTPLKAEEGINSVDGEVVEVKKEVFQDEIEYVPRKVKRLQLHDSKDTKKFVKSDKEALRYLRALENFVLLQANFRAIGVISELETIFRNPDVNH